LFITLPTQHRAFYVVPHSGFRNVGKTQSDAGEIPKRTYTSCTSTTESLIWTSILILNGYNTGANSKTKLRIFHGRILCTSLSKIQNKIKK
jgi:hypothetical protein